MPSTPEAAVEEPKFLPITVDEWNMWLRYMAYAKKPSLGKQEDEGEEHHTLTLDFGRPVKTRIRGFREPSASERREGETPQKVIDVVQVKIGVGGLRLVWNEGPHRIKREATMDQVVAIEQELR